MYGNRISFLLDVISNSFHCKSLQKFLHFDAIIPTYTYTSEANPQMSMCDFIPGRIICSHSISGKYHLFYGKSKFVWLNHALPIWRVHDSFAAYECMPWGAYMYTYMLPS